MAENLPEELEGTNEEELNSINPLNEEDTPVEPVGVEEPESGVEQPKIRRNKKMKYGLKEVADVIFFDIKTDRPVLVFDTSK